TPRMFWPPGNGVGRLARPPNSGRWQYPDDVHFRRIRSLPSGTTDRKFSQSSGALRLRDSILGDLLSGGIIVSNIDLNNRPAFYDDEGFNYQNYWTGRNYEHKAEVIAIRRLLGSRRFYHAADIGGGFGRLSVVLSEFADEVTLVDSSSQQLALAADFLAEHPGVEKRLRDAASLDFPDASVDLVAMVRVLHHLPDPTAELAEVHRILQPDGVAVVEVANVAHALNRVRHMVRRQPLP